MVAGENLRSGGTVSCGCFKQSRDPGSPRKRVRDCGKLNAADVTATDAGMRMRDDPTPEEIAAMCLEIQKDWSPERLAGKGPPPVSVDGFRFSSSLNKTGEFS
jgi:hypothetical protein